MMNKTIVALVLLMAGSAPAMPGLRQNASADRHQQQREMEQSQALIRNKKSVSKSNQASDSHESDEDEAVLADLKTDMAACVQAATKHLQTQQNQQSEKGENAAGNDTASATQPESKTHERVCPGCNHYSVDCPYDQARIAAGNIMTCGCYACGGAIGPIWVFQACQEVAKKTAQKIGSIFQGVL